MHFQHVFLVLLPLTTITTTAFNIVLSNDDGWAEINIRAFYNALTAANESVVLSAPAENESGTGSSDAPATPLTQPCEFNSCPAGSPAQGANASNPRINYVNSYPVTAMRYGIQTLGPRFFDAGGVDIAVAGFNVGSNLGSTTLISGTVGAATEAAKEGTPAIAFSGATGSQIPYTTFPIPNYVSVYTNLSVTITRALLKSGKPYLPPNVWLNVNFPAVGASECSSAGEFEFVLSRIGEAGAGTPKDVRTCGGTRLPAETVVVGTGGGCFASVSVGEAGSKGDATAGEQGVVLGKLGGLLRCLP